MDSITPNAALSEDESKVVFELHAILKTVHRLNDQLRRIEKLTHPGSGALAAEQKAAIDSISTSWRPLFDVARDVLSQPVAPESAASTLAPTAMMS
ncbi:hypothetical protein CAOG_009324 [Capsaspora owczarzaki ATCC 30864]|uniref:Uncharacterized protein n=1 Tax=Capsaspora owczarzaki (strain ATCC 30864) TaxID=595528 RepID=A0A0D2WHJ7_CAPO3|nr:hypothetical protein CAOG_009324 [Capsaspora owczarzaki ATCC 30864]